MTYAPPPRIWRVALLLAVFVCLFGVVGFRLHRLQIEQHAALTDIAERRLAKGRELPAPRGNLYDGTGAPLAVAATTWTLTADPGYMDDKLRATVELARIVPGLDREALRQHFESGKNGRTLARGLDDAQADAIRALKIGKLILTREFSRDLPGGVVAPHVLGFVNTDGKGGAGIEQTLDGRLAGKAGHETYQVDALGKPLLTAGDSVQPPVPGAHVQLAIEVPVQRELEAALAEAAAKHEPLGCAGIVLRPASGEIVAMASWPTFDPRDRATFRPEAIQNRAVQMVYEPGSTLKPLVAGAAVADGLARFEESIFCEHGRWTYRHGKSARTITDHSVTHGGHANLTITEGIAKSDNILMAKLGLRLGPERLWEWITLMRFGTKVGIPLPGESGGILGSKASFKPLGACMSVPMGHEIAVTPIQLAMAHAAIANRGLWLPPRLVKRIWTESPTAEQPLPESAEPFRMFAERDAVAIEQAMTHTMTEGTGKRADLDGYIAAGKTGTTMKLVNGQYSSSHHVGSFVCWAPAAPDADVRDKLLCLIAIDEPKKNGHYGGETAAPAVQRVLQFALERARVPKVDKPEPAKKGKRG